MTIRTTARVAGPFTSAATALPFAFKVYAAADLRVVRKAADGARTTLTLGVHYTVALSADQEASPGGSATLLSPTPAGHTVTVTTAMPALQLMDLTNQGGFFPELLNDTADKLTILVQQMENAATSADEVSATLLPGFPGVTTVQQALDTLLGQVSDGWQAKVGTEAQINMAAGAGTLSPNHFYRSSDTDKVWFSLSPTALLLTAPISGGGGGGGGYTPPPKVVVIGDSMAAQHPLQSEAWPALWETRMRMVGAPVRVVDLAIGGWTYNKANTLITHNGRTMVQQAIAEAPAVVVVNLGANDLALRVEGRTLAQVQGDCNTVLGALRAALPYAVIVVVSEYLFDSTNFPAPGTALKNKGTIPYLMQQKASGILAGAFCAEMLDDQVSAEQKANFADWVTLDTYARGHAAVNGAFDMRLWRAVRLGTVGLDGVHLNMLGQHLLAGYALVAAQTLPALRAVWPQISADQVAEWRDPDALFAALLSASGDGYTQKSALTALWANQLSKHWGGVPLARSDNWWAPSGGSVTLWPQGVTTDEAVCPVSYWKMVGCLPLEACTASVDGGAWNATYGAGATDARGESQGMVQAHYFSAGAHAIRYKVGNEVFGPFTLTVGAKPAPGSIGASSVSASLTLVPAVTQTQQALDFLWTEIGTGYQAKVGTESAILALQSGGTLYPNHLYRSSDTNKVWLALSTNALRLLAPEPAPAAAAVSASLTAVPAVTQTQQALDFLWTEIGTGYQAKVDTEANINALAAASSLYPNHLYRSSNTNKVWLALSTNALLLLAPEPSSYTPPPPVFLRARKSGANQNLTAATWADITLDALNEEPSAGNWLGSSFLVPRSGLYQVNFAVGAQRNSSSALFSYFVAAVEVNSVQQIVGSTAGFGSSLASSAPFVGSAGAGVLRLVSGDVLALRAMCSENIPVIVGSGGRTTHLSLVSLG